MEYFWTSLIKGNKPHQLCQNIISRLVLQLIFWLVNDRMMTIGVLLVEFAKILNPMDHASSFSLFYLLEATQIRVLGFAMFIAND